MSPSSYEVTCVHFNILSARCKFKVPVRFILWEINVVEIIKLSVCSLIYLETDLRTIYESLALTVHLLTNSSCRRVRTWWVFWLSYFIIYCFFLLLDKIRLPSFTYFLLQLLYGFAGWLPLYQPVSPLVERVAGRFMGV